MICWLAQRPGRRKSFDETPVLPRTIWVINKLPADRCSAGRAWLIWTISLLQEFLAHTSKFEAQAQHANLQLKLVDHGTDAPQSVLRNRHDVIDTRQVELHRVSSVRQYRG